MKFSLPATFLFIVAAASAQRPSVEVPNRLTDTIEDYSLQGTSFIDALLKVSARFQLPIGVEWVKSPDTLKSVSFSWSRATVKDVIETVVSAQAGYEHVRDCSNNSTYHYLEKLPTTST